MKKRNKNFQKFFIALGFANLLLSICVEIVSGHTLFGYIIVPCFFVFGIFFLGMVFRPKTLKEHLETGFTPVSCFLSCGLSALFNYGFSFHLSFWGLVVLFFTTWFSLDVLIAVMLSLGGHVGNYLEEKIFGKQ